MLPRSESAESLSSLFSNRRSNVGGAQKDFLAGAGPSSAPQQAQGGTSQQEERIQLKSMVIQRELTETSCIAYAFCLENPRKLRLGICVNESSEWRNAVHLGNKQTNNWPFFQSTLRSAVSTTQCRASLYVWGMAIQKDFLFPAQMSSEWDPQPRIFAVTKRKEHGVSVPQTKQPKSAFSSDGNH